MSKHISPWFRCLSPFFSLLSFLKKGVPFHHDLLVPPGSGSGSGACLPSSFSFLFSGKGFCSIMIYCFLLVPAGFRCLSPFFSLLSFLRKGLLFHHDLLVLPGSGSGSGACLHSSLVFLSSGKRFCSIMIYCFLLVPAGFRCLSPFFSFFCFIASYLYG